MTTVVIASSSPEFLEHFWQHDKLVKILSYGSSDLNGVGKNSKLCRTSGRYSLKESLDWMNFKRPINVAMKMKMPKKVYIAIPWESMKVNPTKIPGRTKNMPMM